MYKDNLEAALLILKQYTKENGLKWTCYEAEGNVIIVYCGQEHYGLSQIGDFRIFFRK